VGYNPWIERGWGDGVRGGSATAVKEMGSHDGHKERRGRHYGGRSAWGINLLNSRGSNLGGGASAMKMKEKKTS